MKIWTFGMLMCSAVEAVHILCQTYFCINFDGFDIMKQIFEAI